MSDLTIHSLLLAIRAFSNEIKVRALADNLGVSYSTIARCKNGVWPRSITFGAVRGVFDDCRERFFGGDESALVSSTLEQLRRQDVDASVLETLSASYEQDGYEAFMSDLLATASRPKDERVPRSDGVVPQDASSLVSASPTHQPEPDAVTLPQLSAVAEPTEMVGAQAEPGMVDDAPDASPAVLLWRRHAQLLLAVPLAIVLILGLLNVRIASLPTLIASNWGLFLAISLAIALSPALAGVLVDAPLAWRSYKKRHPEREFSWQAYAHVAKYGDAIGIEPGGGRYDLTRAYLTYQPLCNVLGMLCYVSLMSFLLTLPNFASYYQSHTWIELFKVGIVVACFVAFGHTYDQARRPPADTSDPTAENPDAYALSRLHVWCNVAHLVWAISLCIILLLGLIAYAIANFRTVQAPPLMVWPYLQGVAFFAHSSMSPYAMRHQATSVGTLLPGMALLTVGYALLTVSCFEWGTGTALVCATCALCLLATSLWARRVSKSGQGAWLDDNAGSGVYSLAIAACIAILLIIGMVTAVLR